jgi:hypothetical protein
MHQYVDIVSLYKEIGLSSHLTNTITKLAFVNE